MDIPVAPSLAFKDLLGPAGTMLAAFIGGALSGFLGPIFLERFRRKRDARNLALAFVGEIKAIKSVVVARHYLAALESTVDPSTDPGTPYILGRLRPEYFGVYKENVSRIGLLEPPLPTLIASFYLLMNSLFEDFEAINQGGRSREELARAYMPIIDLFHQTETIGGEIIEEVARRYVTHSDVRRAAIYLKK